MNELLQTEVCKESLWCLVFDRILIGVILLLVGTGLSYALERVKMGLALKVETRKQRVARIAEVWSAVYESEGASRKLILSAIKLLKDGANESTLRSELTPLEEQSKAKATSVIEAADKNRVWLGDAGYDRVREFHGALMDLVGAVAKADVDALKRSEARLKKARMSIAELT